MTSDTGTTYKLFASSSGDIVSGTVYGAFLFRLNDGSTVSASGERLLSMNLQNSGSTRYLEFWLKDTDGEVQLGVAKNGGAVSYVNSGAGASVQEGVVYFVVLSQQFITPGTSDDLVKLWVNPGSLGAAEAPSPSITINTGADITSGTGLGRFYLLGGVACNIDELRMGTNWSSVTSGGTPIIGTQLIFTTPPTNAVAGALLTPTVVVRVQDASGNNAPSNGVPVTVTLTSGSGTLSGITTQLTDASGLVTFTNLSIDLAGGGKQLTATADGIGSGLASALSSPFTITDPPVASKLAFTTPPGNVVAGASLNNIIVQVQSTDGAAVPTNNIPVTLSLSAGTGSLNGVTTVSTDASGKAVFAALSLDTPGTGKQLTASASGIGAGLLAATSAGFTVTAPPAPYGPVITQALMSASGFILRGEQGAPNADYQVLQSSNVALPSASWSRIATNSFSASGTFNCTNPVSAALTSGYYRLLVAQPAPLDFGMYGYATRNGGTTGGAGGPTVTVSNFTDFSRYVGTNVPYNIQVQGTIDLGGSNVRVRDNKTITGLGTNATLVGDLKVFGNNNVIIRNLILTNPNGAGDNDGLTLQECLNVWVDHCTFIDGADGNLDISHGADWVTVSWCRFYYTNPSASHRFSNLVGHSDNNGGQDTGKLHITFHHNWWGQLVTERMPRVRFGRIHSYNNYFNSPGNNYCIRAARDSEVLVENNYFDSVKNVWERYVTVGEPAKLYATGNILVNTTWSTTDPKSVQIPGTDSLTSDANGLNPPPYAYAADPASVVPAQVTAAAGAGKGPFAP